MADSLWWPAYPNDWLGSVKIMLMNIAEEGAYNRLLHVQWTQPDCTLPDDPTQLKVLAKIVSTELDMMIDFSKVMACFVKHRSKPGRIYNPRLMEEWKKMKELRRKKSESGKSGMAIRWGKQRYNTPITEGITKHNSLPAPSPLPEEEEKKEKEKSLNGSKRPRSVRPPKLSDQEFFTQLKTDPTYAGLNIDRIVGRCQNWCRENGKVFSRRRLVNWLNREERPLEVSHGTPPPSVAKDFRAGW